MALPLFSFDPSKGETLETLERRRRVAEAMLANIPQANTIGGGLAALGQAIGGRLALGRANRGIAAGQAGAASRFGDFMGGIGGGTPDPGGAAAVTDVLSGSSGGDTMASPPGGGGSRYQNAIAGIESGGKYGIIGPRHKTLGRALGKYQVMEANVGPWSREALGREVSANEFLSNPQIQDAVFDHKFGQYVSKYGPEKAARAWFGGEGNIENLGANDVFGTTVGGYGSRFMKSLGGEGSGKAAVAGALSGGIRDDTLGATPLAIDPAAKDDALPVMGTAAVPAPVAPVEAGMIDPAAKDNVLPTAPAFVPAGGATPYPDDLGTSDPAYRKMVEERPMSGITVPQTPGAVPLPPVTAPVAPPAAPVAPVSSGVAPVAKALGVDPLPQTSGLMGPVASAGHESLSPGVGPVSAALSGGGGANTLAGGGGRGIIGRLFGGGGPRPAASGAANPVATAMSGGAGAAGPAGTPGASGGGGLSDTARKAIAVIQNPWSNEGQLAVAKEILGQELKQLDPKYRVELEAAQEALRQAQTPTRAMTDAEKRDQGIDPTINARIDAKGNVTEGPKVEPKIINNRAYHPVTGEELWRAPPGTQLLTSEEAKAMRLPLGAGNWMVDADGKPSVIPGTEPSDPEYNDYVREALAAGEKPVDRLFWKKASAVSVSTSIGGEAGPDQKLRAKLSEKEGERWSTLMETGNQAAGRAQQLEVLGELLKMAPQGPVTGWLAEQFPGYSSAGDAANAIIQAIVPTMRVTGSGATSDIEFNGMRKAMVGLGKDPLGNQIILETMMAKTNIDIQRAEVISEYMSVDPTDEKATAAAANIARKKLIQLDRASILTPKAYALIAKAGGFAGAADDPVPEKPADASDWPSQAEWDQMSDDEKAAFEGSN